MHAVIIGSAAYLNEYPDIDLIADQGFIEAFKERAHLDDESVSSLAHHYVFPRTLEGIVEIHVPKEGTAHHRVLMATYDKCRDVCGFSVSIAPLPVLAALKKAHLIQPHKWSRHIEQYVSIKQLLNVDVFRPKDFGVAELYKLHRKEILACAKAHPKLNVRKGEFFGEGERYNIFDHDTVHKAVALGDVPAYTLMKDGEVWCSRAKWREMSEDDRLRCLLEEASVLALERSIIPALFLKGQAFMGSEWAFKMALQKICTTITSGFFRDYSIEHYQQAVDNRPDYVNLFFEGVKQGVVVAIDREVICGLK